MNAIPRIVELGRRAYGPVYDEMVRTHEEVRAGTSPGAILIVEHEPIYTAGRATPREQIAGHVVEIERGGQLTYHGPGQLVVYPIVRLPARDVRAWLRAIEAFGVAVCERFGLPARPSVDGTGVFVTHAGDRPRKVASIGVAIRNWINLHGIAINVDMDLGAFHAIRPCGLDPEVMSDLSREAGRRIGLDAASAAAVASLPVLLGSGYASSE